MNTRIPAALAAISLLAGCGYVGEPLPPALNIPIAVKDLRVIEYGDNLLIEFTAPETSTEGVTLKSLRGVELRVGPTEPNFNLDRWVGAARRIDAEVAAPGEVVKEIPAREFAGKEIVVAVRAIGPKGRTGAWSNLATLAVIEPLKTPTAFNAAAAPQGVQLSWSRTGNNKFRIFRGTRQESLTPIGESDAPNYTDSTAAFGTPYRYFVQAVQGKVESAVSETVRITPIDTFPPAVPTGLTASAGAGTVELAWERNTETDFRGYRVYRALEAGPFTRLTDNVDTPVFTDRTATPGKKYRYAVSSVDLSGNESKQSFDVDMVAPEKP